MSGLGKHVKTQRGGVRHRKAIAAIAAIVLAVAIITPLAFMARSGWATEGGTTVVDPDTTNSWQNFTAPGGVTSTQNVGRIWTDKSVFNETYTFEGQLSGSVQKGDSDFIVGLSALSSTSNLTETTTSTTPLDIVLVLDLSGSMNNSLSSSRQYTPVYDDDVNTNGRTTYYAQREDGSYVEIERVTTGWLRPQFDHWELDGQEVEPMRSASDTQSGRIQFYTYQTVNQTKMDALKSAANQFIDSVGELNQNVTDENNLSRIAIVKYADDSYRYTIGNDRGAGGNSSYNYTQVVSDFTSDADDLKGDIDSLRAGGATAADYGLTMAQHVLDGGQYGGWNSDTYQGARDDAQKVVIFFTDGEPNHGNGFDGDVAATSVNVAHAMKQAGTTVYTIGVLNGADPSADPTDRWTSDVNKYLHAVSSNYKDATAVNWRGSASWDDLNLGDRTQDKDGGNANYYYAAEDAAELDQVFKDITTSITESAGSGSPIQGTTEEGAQETPGDLTFTDQLGSYMEVTGTGAGADKMQLAYADTLYTSTSRSEESFDGGSIYTYHFKGNVDGNAVYGPADLSSITVKVTHYDNAEQGDLVQVTIPASLIPLRNYDVNVDDHTMKVDEAYPIRLFYGVSLKQAAADAIKSGTGDAYDALVKSNGSENGSSIDFYTNLYTNGNGDTTATFTPNEANKFYYYTSDTPLYTDEGCTDRATWGDIASGTTVYYQDTYYVQSEDGYEQKTDSIAIESTDLDYSKIKTNQQDQAYMPAHTQRGDRPATLNTDKSPNETKTASTVLVPSWIGANEVSQALGNNGKMTFTAPGSLEIKKSVNWGNASDSTEQDKNSFTFKVELTAPEGVTLADTYSYAVYDSGEDPVNTGTVAPGGTVTIAQDQRVVIAGLPAGTTYTVTEQDANKNGFTVLDSSTGEGANTSDGVVEGTIVAGSQQSVDYTNTYKAADVNLSTEATLQVKKSLTGRDWRDTDEFTFEIDGLAGPNGTAAPEPSETTVKVSSTTPDYTAAFGDITFTQPGEYRYAITEVSDGIETIPGIDYSAARYRVVVNVSDNGTGNLLVDSVTIEQRLDDEGHTPQSQPTIDNNTMVFTNNYDLNAATTNIDGTKNYTDTTGTNPINADKFTFQLKALGGYETEGGSANHYTVAAADVPMPAGADENHAVTTTNTGYGFGFATIKYDGFSVGKTYVYEVSELKGDNPEAGMNYDENTKYTVKVTVSEVDDPENAGQKIIVATPDLDPEDIVFNNTYDPADAELKGDDAIHGTKVLTGRDMNQGETFYFQLTQTGGPATLDPNDDPGAYVQVLSAPEYAAVSQADGDMDFNFKDMEFSVAGTYTFQVNEVANENGDETTDGAGLTYDKNICTVTVEVTDNHDGTMTATPIYKNQGHDETDKAVFANTYKASMNYGANGAGGINVTKQMLDRPMANGDFTFTITPEGDDTAYETFTNTAAEKNGTVTMKQLQNLTFDQDDAGKTFTYIVDESDPAEGAGLPGVDYDQSQYKVQIAVYDNGDGTMHTVTTVTKIKDAAGNDVNEAVIENADSSAEGYTVPTFGFVNDYNPNEITVGGEDAEHPLQVTKTVEGAPSPEGVEYGFTLTPAADYGDKVQGLTGGKLTAHTTDTIAEGESQTVNFGTLTFTEPGTYTFNVQEDQPEADDGWTFDDADGSGQTDTHQITVVVTDLNNKGEYDGDLHIQSVTGSPAQVTNSYHANEITVGGGGAQQQITVQKTVTGSDSTESFKFQLTPVVDDTNTQEVWDNSVDLVDPEYDGTATINGGVTQAKAGTANFGGIIFRAEGTYQFNVTEVQAHDGVKDPAGWTYDTHTSVVTVKVTDEGNDGQLDAAVSYDNSQATTDADKAVNNAAAFTNSYTPDETTTTDDTSIDTNILVTKEVTGAPATEAFTFELKKAEDQDYSNVFEGTGEDKTPFDDVEVTTSDNLAAGASETKAFAGVTFTAPGDYKFVIDETTTTDKAGWTYDGSTHEITVHVADQDAKLVITSIDGNNPKFTNSYTPNEVTTDGQYGLENLQVTKEVTGAPATEDFSFSLKLTSGDINNVKLGSGEDETAFPADGISTSTNDLTGKEGDAAKQTVSFGDMSFTATGTYTFEVVETTTTDKDGWHYDNAPKTITVEVTDGNFDGQLDAKVTGDNPTITNNYTAGSVTVGDGEASGPIQVTKNIEGTAPATEDFNFELAFDAKADGNTGKAENIEGLNDGKLTAKVSKDSLADNTETVSFGDLTFKAEGEYYFTVTETTKAAENSGWTYDNTAKTVIVSVTDTDHDGHLEATVHDDAATVTNSYKASSVSTEGEGAIGNLQVTKEVKGNGTDEAFSFTATLTSDNAANVLTDADNPKSTFPTDGITASTKAGFTDGQTKAATFGSLTFTAEGDYTFKVVENGTAPANWTYATGEDNAKTITIHVTDTDHDGKLEAAYDETDGNNPTFTNTYKAEGELPGTSDTEADLTVTKTIDGRTFQKGDAFTFTLTADEKNPTGVTLPDNAGDLQIAYAEGDGTETTSKSANFGNIKFTLPGTYTFYVSEQTPDDADKLGGITYSAERYTVTVEVTDAEGGGLDAHITSIKNKAGDEVTETTGMVFTNTYKPSGTTDLPTEGTGSIQLQKVLTGKAWDGDEFTFQIAAGTATAPDGSSIDTVPMPEQTEVTVSEKTGTNDEHHDYADFTFGPITYDKAGTYTYTVTEVKPGIDDDSFNAGMEYSTNKATVTVNVTDNKHGGFTAAATVQNGTFTNNYASSLDFGAEGQGGLWIHKSLTNHNIAEGQFEFTVTAKDQASADKAGFDGLTKVLKSTSGKVEETENGQQVAMSAVEIFSDATFTQDDAGETYTYTVQETKGGGAGYVNDDTVYTVTITTTDDGQGGIEVSTRVQGGDFDKTYVYDNDDSTQDEQAVVPFDNSYNAKGELGGNGATSIKATKTLTNRPMTAGEFAFIVTDADGNQVTTGENDANGNVTFGVISYEMAQLLADAESGLASYQNVDGKDTFTYEYTVAEDQENFDEGVTAIAGSFQIKVTVTDNNNGTLSIAVAYPDGGDSLQFRNAYGEGETGQATLNINGTKGLKVESGDNAPDIAGKYTFTLTGEDGAPMPATTTAKNDAAGNVNFGDITYTMENVFGDTGAQEATDDATTEAGDTAEATDETEATETTTVDEAAGTETEVDVQSAQRTKTFTYTVTESGDVAGVTNDAESYKTFTVTVTDNGNGTISVATDQATDFEFGFTNTYSVTPVPETPTGEDGATGTGHFAISKTLDGRDMADGEFSFAMTDAQGNKVSEGTNDASGNMELSAITFSEPGDYTYTLAETNNGKGGITYDQHTYQVAAHVTDNGDGTLSVAWSVKDANGNPIDAVSFSNTYSIDEPGSIIFGATKVLDGRELKGGEFSFELKDADGKVLQTATNDANGQVVFTDPVVYDQPGSGTYTYTVSEVKGDAEGVTYDDTVYTATVTVTDNGDGSTSASVSYGTGNQLPVFTNVYTAPEQPSGDNGGVNNGDGAGDIPQTSDFAPTIIGTAVLAGAAFVTAGVVMRKKRGE